MEKPIREQCIYDGKIVRLMSIDVELPNGKTSKREVIRHPGGSAVVAFNEKGEIALVRQYRTAMGRFMLELPAGKLDRGEDPFVAAKRELAEETGMRATNWSKLGEYISSPGFCDEVIHLYVAQGESLGERHLDEDEFVDVIWMPFHEAVQSVTTGLISDGKSICGILLAQQKRGR